MQAQPLLHPAFRNAHAPGNTPGVRLLRRFKAGSPPRVGATGFLL
jgi:hypothetical protein